MSRSYRKNNFDSYVCYSRRSMKAWRTQENRRLRHNAKQIINNCLDYDKLIIPVLNDYDTLWGSPQDGRKHYIEVPALNQCEIDHYEYLLRWGTDRGWYNRYYGFKDGHYRKCRCYYNKRNWYWKTKRK